MKPVLSPASVLAAALLAGAFSVSGTAWAQPNYPVTASQRAAAQAAAARGVRISELAPNAPNEYIVRRGDTLWDISGKFLRNPWRWPALWGMNRQQIRNPHLIYPGQRLWLERDGQYARLRTGARSGGGGGIPTVRVSPRNRVEMLDSSPIPTLPPHLIEPFLAEPLVFDDDTLQRAPRVVATVENRALVSKGDRAYVRGPAEAPLMLGADLPTNFRVFREAVPLKDIDTNEILGYEGQYVGQVELVRSEGEESGRAAGADADNKLSIPATVEVTHTREEIRPGDRLIAEPSAYLQTYTPTAPEEPLDARVISLYGSNAVRFVGQNQIVAINRGGLDGLAPGHVVALISTGQQVVDRTVDGNRERIKLPDERNGLGMVFRTFERVSYVLVLQIQDVVKVGDRVTNPN